MENWNSNFSFSFDASPPSITLHPNQTPTPTMLTEMPQFDLSSFSSYYHTNNVALEQSQMTTRGPPLNQPVGIDRNGFRPSPLIIPCPNQNPDGFDQSSFSSHYQTGNVMLEQSPPCPQNQPMRIENGFSWPGDQKSKTDEEIHCENYLKQYSDDSLPTETPVDRNWLEELGDLWNSDPALMNCFNFEDTEITSPVNGTTQFCSSSTYNNLYATAPAPMVSTGLLSDVVNLSSGNRKSPAAVASPPTDQYPSPRNEPVAATYGGARSSQSRSIWNHREHKLLLVGMAIFGKGDWKNIANKVVITKSHTQVASHAQKYFLRQELRRKRTKNKRMSIHDIDSFEPELMSEVCARLRLTPPTLLPLPSSSSSNCSPQWLLPDI